MKTILLLDACMRRKESRTLQVAQALLCAVPAQDLRIETVPLWQSGPAPRNAEAQAARDAKISAGELDGFAQARQFAAADGIVVAAPFWDFSFPAALRAYFEEILVPGIAFHYEECGAVGDCAASHMAYITTRGGYIDAENPAAADCATPYLRGICAMCGVPHFDCVAAEGLDIIGNDARALVNEAIARAAVLGSTFWEAKG